MRYTILFLIAVTALAAFASNLQAQQPKKRNPPLWSDQKDASGDPLPIGAIARIGTSRYRLANSRQPESALLSPDGKLLAVLGNPSEIEIWQLPAWKRHRPINGHNLDQNNPPQFQSLVFSPDSKKLATFDGAGQRIYLFDVDTGKSIKKIALPKKENQQPINQPVLKWSGDQQTLICIHLVNGGNDQNEEVLVWDLGKDKLVRSFNVPMNRLLNGRPNAAIPSDASRLAQVVAEENPGGQGNARWFIEIWDLATGKSLGKHETEMGLQKLAYSPDGKWLAACNGQSLLRIHDADGKEKHNIRLRRGQYTHLEFSADSRALYLAEFPGKIHQWDPVTGDRIASHPTPKDSVVRQFAFPPGGKVLALGSFGNAFDFWEVAAGKLFSPIGLPTGAISEVAFVPNGELFVASDDGMLAWWNPRTALKLRDLKLEAVNPGNGFDGVGITEIVSIRDRGNGALVKLSSNGEFLTSGNGDQLGFFEVKTGKLLYDDPYIARAGAVCFLEGGAKAVAVQNKKVRIWNTRTGRDVAHFNVPLRADEQALGLQVSPNGKHFAIRTMKAGVGDMGRLLLWDVDKEKIVRELPVEGNFEVLRFSPDNQWLTFSGQQEHVSLTRIGAAKGTYELKVGQQGDDISQIAFSPDSRQLACAAITRAGDRDASRIFIYELASKKIRLELVGHPTGVIERLAYSHDSGLLASGATDTTVLVWNAGLRAFAAPSPPTPLPKGEGSSTEATDDDLAYWFQQMAGPNAKGAFRNMIRLAQTPKQAVKLFGAKIAPTKKPDPGVKTFAQWIDDLGSSQFAIRSKASAMLQKIGGSIESDLRAALPRAKDVEMKRRIEEILERIVSHEWTPEEVLHARAVEVVEAIASPEARALLTRWTTGDPAAVLTQEARKSLDRLR